MIIKELICNHIKDIEDIFNSYLKYYPLLEEYEIEKLKENDIDKIYKNFKNKIKQCFETVKNTEIEIDKENIIFIVTQKSTEYKSNEIHLNSFMCKKSEIEERIKNDFTIWNGNDDSRIEHYGYDMNMIKDIINKEIYIENSLSEIDVLADIVKSLSSFGWTDKEKEKNLNSFYKDIEEGIKDIEEGRCYKSEEVFEHLEMELLGKMSKEEVLQK